jgi:hypothetical protein
MYLHVRELCSCCASHRLHTLRMSHRSSTKLRTFCLALTLGLGLGCVVNTDGDGDGDGGSNDSRIASTCTSYCTKAHDCDDDQAIDGCVEDCKEQLGDCMADEQAQTLDDLDSCAVESCDDFGGCTIGAGLQCTFGI